MAWLHSHQSLRDHPKKDRLAEVLFNGSVTNDVSDLAAIGILHCLWWWALDYAQDGDLSKFSDRQVAKACGWQGDGTLLVQALIEARFVDKKTRHIHDWDEYAGRLLEQRDRERTRVKNWRAKSSVHVANADGTPLVPGRKREREREKDLNSTRPVDNSTVRPDAASGQEPEHKCWRCDQPITADELLEDKCVLSSRGIRHALCPCGASS